VVQRQPNDTLVDTLSVLEVRERLEETLLRSVNPPIQSVVITDDFLRYRLNIAIYEIQINFKNVNRVDVYGNKWTFVRGHEEQIIARIYFSTELDAQTFADLLMSLRAHYYRSRTAPRKS
jgi:hypothetical protein